MYEEKIKDLGKFFFENEPKKKYFFLTHLKHKREYYLMSGNSKALEFIYPKMNSIKKRIMWIGLKLKIIQPFLKKIMLPTSMGSVIYCGNQIKSFNFERGVVLSSPLTSNISKKEFIESKKQQNELAKIDFAPEIVKLNKEFPASEEELLKTYVGENLPLFKKMVNFYIRNEIIEKDAKKIIKKIKTKLVKLGIFEKKFERALKKCSKLETLLFSKVHGDFAKEQCLIKGNKKIIFTDWNLKEDIIVKDLISFFRKEINFLKNGHILKIFQEYPLQVLNNLKEYLIIGELLFLCDNSSRVDIARKRIDKLLD